MQDDRSGHLFRAPVRTRTTLGFLAAATCAVLAGACSSPARDTPPPAADSAAANAATANSGDETAFLDTLQARTFRWFWDLSDPRTGLTPDRRPTVSFQSISATGFALTAYPIGVERGYVSRERAADRVLTTLRFLRDAPQGTAASGTIGYRGFFYHFLEPETGTRFKDVELSTVDTALLLAGALFCGGYFDRPDGVEPEIRSLADTLYARADWRWAQVRPPAIGHGWDPDKGFLPYDWRGMNEAMLVYLLALGSPTHPVDPAAWDEWTSTYRWGTFHDQSYVGFGPLFGYHYTHVWFDFRGIADAYMREKGIDYFENARRATLAQHAYAVENPGGWAGYGPDLWGLTACDGPLDGTVTVDGRPREFHTYWGRGASFLEVRDDGTVAPTAAAGSIVYAPELVIPTLMAIEAAYGDRVFNAYGFVDALNPTLTAGVEVQMGTVVPGLGWFDTDQLGIDQGPILAMTENYRTGLVWRVMRRNPYVIRGLERAGFTGGWLDSAGAAR